MAGSDDRIDVVVTDGVDPNIDRKLRSIADNADRGAASVLRLKAELASIQMTPVAKLNAATETSTATLNKQLLATGALKKETDASAASDIKAVASKGKLTAAVDAEAAAQARLAAVLDKTIARQEAANVAAASTAFGKGGNPFQGEANLAAEAAAVGAGANAMKTEVAAAEVATVGSFGRIKNSAMNTFDFLRDAVYAQAANFKGFFGAGGASTLEKEAVAVGKVGTAAKANSKAINETFTLFREASRGNFTRMAGSATILAQALGLLNTVLIPLAVVAAGAAAGMKLFQVSIEKDADPQLKAYANTLGLTSKEMRKLGDETVGAEGKLKKFNTIKLTFGDVFHGLVKTIEDTFNLQPALNKMKNDVVSALTDIVKTFFEAAAELSGVMVAAYRTIVNVWNNFPKIMGDIFVQAVNMAAKLMEDMVNDAIGAINKFAQKANSLIGINLFGQISNVQIPRMKNDFAGAAASVGKSLTEGYKQGHDNAIALDSDFLARWKKNSIDAGKDRLKAMADAIKGNRNPKKETDPKTKADYLNDTNKKLDDELSRMHLLKDAREEQQRLDQIEEEFAKRRQPLTAKEIQGFKDKIHAIQEFKAVQAEMDRIYDQAAGPQKTFNAAISASNDLLKRGAIDTADYNLAVGDATRTLAASKDLIGANNALRTYQEALDKIAFSLAKEGITQQQANEQTNLATRAYAEASDRLFSFKEAMTANTIAAGLYGDAAQRNAYYQSLVNSEYGKANNLSPQYVAGINAEVDALMKKNQALQQQTYIQSQVGGIVNPILEDAKFLANKRNFYAEIDRLRQTDVLNDQQAQRAKYAIAAKYDELRLAGASQFFGELAGLASSGNKKLAAIGKAAAIAQATIDGFVAVQKALASAPPPWNFAMAAAVALKTGMQVAGIVSTNVGGFKDGGDFMVQGNAGVDRNNISMSVSRGERVIIQTPAQQRANGQGGVAPSVTVPVKVINVHDKREILAHMESDAGERVILNVIKNNPTAVAAAAGASN